jgi:predicted nucleic acid-binding protein
VIVVSNSSPLIAGLDIGLGAIFAALFGEVFIPPAVRQEVFTSRPQPSWITEHPLTNPSASRLLQGRLGVGEREAIALTVEVKADLLLMDELAGRRTATSPKIPYCRSPAPLAIINRRVFSVYMDCLFRFSMRKQWMDKDYSS